MVCSWKHKLTLVGIYALGWGVFYLYPNMFPLREPRLLPLLALDRQMPFLPWTFLVYTSDYLLILSVLVLLREQRPCHAFARLAFGVLVLCGLVFLFFPTTYPRPPYPEVDNPLIRLPMQFIHAVDTPANCFPSMHVALTAVSAWAVRGLGRPLAIGYGIWTLAIAVSTMTTKQHYFADVLGGLGVAGLVICLDRFVIERKFYARPGQAG